MKNNAPLSLIALLSASILSHGTAYAQQSVPVARKAPQNLIPEAQQKPANPTPNPAPASPAPGNPASPSNAAQTNPDLAHAFDSAAIDAPKIVTQAWPLASARALAAYIKTIGKEGLFPADYKPAELQNAIAKGEGAELDQLASRAFSWIVEDLRDGRTPMDARKQWFVFDPDQDRYTTEALMKKAVSSGNIAATLAEILPTHPDYAKLRAELAKTPAASTTKRKLIMANMERWRWLARDLGSQYLLTNVPEFQLRLMVNGNIVRTYRTVVGKPGNTATPQLAESVEGVIFNPTWTVPQSIVVGEGLGAKVLANPEWAETAGYTATKGANGYVTVVQQPGPTNSLGLMKLDMPNQHAIFLHDTPSRNLFSATSRALSHGCIRTERATELAMALAILRGGLTGQEAKDVLTSGEYTKIGFEKPMPVYITYFTMGTSINGVMQTYADIYERDAPVIASLAAPRVPDRSRVTGEQVIVLEDDLQDT